MAFELAVVTAFVAGLSVTATLPDGTTQALVMRDFGAIHDAADQRAGPVFQPDVTRKITVQTLERNSFGPGSVAKATLRYTIPYVLLYKPLGQLANPNIAGLWSGAMVATVKAIVTAIINNDTPVMGGTSVDLLVGAVLLGQTVTAPNGDQHHGAQFDLLATEFVN